MAKKTSKQVQNICDAIESAPSDLESLEETTFLIKFTDEDLISTGSTLLDLACSDSTAGGYRLGSGVHIIGDSHVGKTLLCLTTMAEAARSSKLDRYNLIYGNYEAAMDFPLVEMFGEKMPRMKIIPTDEELASGVYTIQDWSEYLLDKIPVPFIHVTDSLDALPSMQDLGQSRPEQGGWRTEKAAVISNTMPKLVGKIKSTKSLLILISQTRDNIGVSFGDKKRFSGGNAFKFFRAHAIWLAIIGRITKKVRGKDREIGVNVLAKIRKNKLTGKIRQVEFPIFHGFGVDDVGSCVDWLVSEKFWTKSGHGISTEGDLGLDSNEVIQRNRLIEIIERDNLEPELKRVVGECWNELEAEIQLQRKNRYG